MTFKSTALDMISAPNYYAPAADGLWVLTSPNAQTLWFRLDIADALGSRPYCPANGATLQVTFMRADLLSVNMQGNLVNTVQNVVKNAAANASNRTLWSIALTTQDVQTALSGTVKFALTESGVTTTWLQNWMVKKLLTDPGM